METIFFISNAGAVVGAVYDGHLRLHGNMVTHDQIQFLLMPSRKPKSFLRIRLVICTR